MLSIGQIAHSTGVSRRMLRHWEEQGLLAPADVDPVTGYRRYEASQLGRVRAIVALRDLGLGFGDVGRVLDPEVDRPTLVGTLERHADLLRREIAEASTRLNGVQQRLDALRRTTQEIAMYLTLQSLPALNLWGLRATVLDETEIGEAVAALRERVPVQGDVALLFDGTRDDAITVSVAISSPFDGAEAITTPAVDAAVTVRFNTPPASVADAWVLIDDELAARGLTTWGVYRQVVGADGVTQLQAPVRALA